MRKEEMWERYRMIHPEAISYDAWSFCGGGPVGDELTELVLEGRKTATASAHQLYKIEGAQLPSKGGLNIILWSNGDAACITRTLDVEVCRFADVTAEHAYNEGEGDRSLEHWRDVHRTVFSKDLEEVGLRFDDDMLVVCETFELVMR